MTRAGMAMAIIVPIVFILAYLFGGWSALDQERVKQEKYNVAYQWCVINTEYPDACQWGAYTVLNP